MSESADPTETASSLEVALTRMLWELDAIQVSVEDPFILASGNRSPIYVNCRRVISSPQFMRLFTAAARAMLQDASFDAVAGGATAGIPYAAWLASDLNRPLLYVRKAAKEYGTGSQVEGAVESGWRVLLVEDLITDGGSKLPFVDALTASEATVTDVLVLFDRQQGGEALLSSRGLRLRALARRDIALAIGTEDGRVKPSWRDQMQRYFEDPEAWHRDRGFDFHEVG